MSFTVLAQVGVPHLRLGAAPGNFYFDTNIWIESDNHPTTEMDPETTDSVPFDYAPYFRELIGEQVGDEGGQSASAAGALRSPATLAQC